MDLPTYNKCGVPQGTMRWPPPTWKTWEEFQEAMQARGEAIVDEEEARLHCDLGQIRNEASVLGLAVVSQRQMHLAVLYELYWKMVIQSPTDCALEATFDMMDPQWVVDAGAQANKTAATRQAKWPWPGDHPAIQYTFDDYAALRTSCFHWSNWQREALGYDALFICHGFTLVNYHRSIKSKRGIPIVDRVCTLMPPAQIHHIAAPVSWTRFSCQYACMLKTGVIIWPEENKLCRTQSLHPTFHANTR